MSYATTKLNHYHWPSFSRVKYLFCDHILFLVKTKRCGITKSALVEAAIEDDLAAEYNEQLNEYNRLILQMIQENFELHKVSLFVTTGTHKSLF